MKRVNLIPSEKHALSFFAEKQRKKMILGLLLFVGICFLWQTTMIVRYQGHIVRKKRALKELQATLTKATSSFETMQAKQALLEKERKTIEQRLALLKESKRENIPWSKVLLQLGELVPKEMGLRKISLNKDVITIEGTTVDNAVISDFMIKLDDNKYFQNTTFRYTQKAKEEGVEFEVATHLTPGAMP